MDDLISRQAALNALGEEPLVWDGWWELYKNKQWRKDVEAIKSVPSAQKKGQWLPDNNNYFAPYFVCSHCHSSYRVDTVMGNPTWKYCPNCGADMRGA